MFDDDNVWLVPENEEEIVLINELVGNPREYSKIKINYRRLRQLFKLDYIQIGIYDGKYEEILGYLKLENYKFSVKNFEPIKTISNKYFIPFFKYLTKDIKKYFTLPITFYYNKSNYIVFVSVVDLLGAIACLEEEL